MSGPSEFENRLKRLIQTDRNQTTCPSWSATVVIFVSGMIVGFVMRNQETRVPMSAKDKLYTRNNNQWPTR